MEQYIRSYLQEKQIEFREAGDDQLVLAYCPYCGDNKAFHHFYINKYKGLFDCKKCSIAGNFNMLRKTFGDAEIDLTKYTNEESQKQKIKKEYKPLNHTVPTNYAARLHSLDKHFLKYLLEVRKLDESVIKRFRVGSTGKEITIPIYENSVLVNIRYRRDPSKDGIDESPRYTSEKGCKSALFNGDKLKEPLKICFLTEGEFDAMQLIQRGIENTVSVTLGSSYFPEEWAEKFKDIQTVFIIFDNDEAGKNGAKKAAEKIGVDKCKLVHLPSKPGRKKTDLTNYFVDDGFTKADFMELVNHAKPVSLVADDTVKHISEFNEQIRELLIQGDHLGKLTGFNGLDEMMGGLRKGRLIIISGLTNSGKTSFSLNMALDMAKRKLPVFFFSMEMPPIDIVKKVIMLEAKLTNTQLKEIVDPSTELQLIDKTLATFKDSNGSGGLPMYLYNGSGALKFEVVAECARIAKQEYNAECIFIDHLHYFVQNYNNLTSDTSKLVRQIKQLAMSLDIPIVLLAHLNRGGRSKSRTGLYVPSLSDLRDTGALEQDADQVIFVCRDSESSEKTEREKAIIKLAKNRDGYAGRTVSMIFDEEITSFLEVAGGVDFEMEKKQEEDALRSDVVIPDVLF